MNLKQRLKPPTMDEMFERLLHIDDLSVDRPSVVRECLLAVLLELPPDIVEFVFERTAWIGADAELSECGHEHGYAMAGIPAESGYKYLVTVPEGLTRRQASRTLPLAIANAYVLATQPGLQGPPVRQESRRLAEAWTQPGGLAEQGGA